MMKKIIFVFVSVSLLFTTLILNAQNYYELSTQDSYELWNTEKNNPNFVVIDIREASAYKVGHIENAINIDYYQTDEFYAFFDALDKSKKYLVYCASSTRSGKAIAAFKTRNLDFDYMVDLKGGLNSWVAKGYPTTTTPPTANVGAVGNAKIYLFPNPSNGTVTIQTNDNQQVKVMNAIGNIVYERDYNQGLHDIDLTQLPKGLYVVKLKSGNQYLVEKLIIE